MSVHISDDNIVHIKIKNKKRKTWTSLEVQWLRLQTSTAGGTSSIPGLGTKIPHAMRPKKKSSNQMLDGCMVVWIGPVLAISDTLPRIIQLLSRQAKENPNIELSGTEENLQSLNPTPAPPRNKISWTVLPRTNSLCQLLVTFHPELHRHHSGRKENGLYLVPA